MLDYDRLKAPQGDGEVLVLPAAHECARSLQDNSASLRIAETPIAGRTLSYWRRVTRATLLGDADRPAIVLGHQPEFIHAGVWAKHVVAQRLAQSVGGVAVNLVVDNDTPRATTLSIPSVRDGHLALTTVSFPNLSARRVYEELAPLSLKEYAAVSEEIRQAMGDRFDASLMPVFLDALGETDAAHDGVSQLVTARRAAEGELGINIEDHRVSEADWTPLLIGMMQDPARFAECYNASLAAYRAERRIRGKQRPMPDLQTTAHGIELPIWAVRRGDSRQRVFVTRDANRAALRVEDKTIAALDLDDHAGWRVLVSPLDATSVWRLRPRALTLTLWARLFLADLFIHGIGGARYDRICDDLIRGYFHALPPAFMCVSATLHLELPLSDKTSASPVTTAHQLRDWAWNPQRHLTAPRLRPLFDARNVAVGEAEELRTRRAPRPERRLAFEAIRRATQTILDQAPEQLHALQRAVDSSRTQVEESRIAQSREYFFALHTRPALRRLMDALPDAAAFRV